MVRKARMKANVATIATVRPPVSPGVIARAARLQTLNHSHLTPAIGFIAMPFDRII